MASLLRISLFLSAVCLNVAAFQPGKLGGKWFAEFKIASPKTGKTVMVKMTLDLSPRGQALSGTLTNHVGSRAIKHDIKEGKIDGAGISFLEIAQAPQGEQTIAWAGSLEGATLKMTRSLKGGRRKQTIVFNR